MPVRQRSRNIRFRVAEPASVRVTRAANPRLHGPGPAPVRAIRGEAVAMPDEGDRASPGDLRAPGHPPSARLIASGTPSARSERFTADDMAERLLVRDVSPGGSARRPACLTGAAPAALHACDRQAFARESAGRRAPDAARAPWPGGRNAGMKKPGAGPGFFFDQAMP